MSRISRRRYSELYGPTTGDLVRLADSSLFAEIEHDHCPPGEELAAKVGGNVRDGLAIQARAGYGSGAPEYVVAGAVVLDPVLGVVKGDIGIRNGRIVAIGKAGNPDVQDGVHPDLVLGPHTTVLRANGMLVTPGGVESHAHLLSPAQVEHLLSGGFTTVVAMDWGDHLDIAVSGPMAVATMVRAFEQVPLNVGFLARGSTSDPDALLEGVAFGCLGVKVHEDLGAMPVTIDTALAVADRHDFAVCLHTDSLNESGYCEDTIAAIAGRSIHLFHTEGAGGGHVPDIIRVNGLANVIPSSTNPTNPYTRLSVDEATPMTMLVHGLSASLPEDVAFAESRGRAMTMMAEDLLHDLGAISIFGADTQGMGRAAESTATCWRLASVMKDRTGRLATERTDRADNERVRRYLAKLTINPARAYGLDEHVGSIEPGKLADLVLWEPATFAVRPRLVLKAGVPVWGAMGDPSGTTTLSEPVVQRAQWGKAGNAAGPLGALFVSRVALDYGYVTSLGTARPVLPMQNVRRLGKVDMLHNDALPVIEVDPRTFEVRADGVPLVCEPATDVPFGPRYLLR
jgi:urease subunit alpha